MRSVVSLGLGPENYEMCCQIPQLNDWLSGKIRPSCVCHDMLSAEPTWPSVTVDGVEHIAASAGTVPWPEELHCSAKWPATLSLPPRWDDIAACVRSSFRGFRKKCKIRCTDHSTEAVIQECVAEHGRFSRVLPRMIFPFPGKWLRRHNIGLAIFCFCF